MVANEEMEKASSLELKTYLGDEEAARLMDPAAISERIVSEILQADTLEALLSRGTTVEAKDILFVGLEVSDVSYNPSALKEGVGVYSLITAKRTDTGEEVLITCGARNVMAQLYRAKEMGWMPFTCRLVETAKATASGFKVMSLEPYKEGDF